MTLIGHYTIKDGRKFVVSVLIINGSPMKNGPVAAITNKFIAGVQDAGQDIIQYEIGTDPLPPWQTDDQGHFTPDDQRADKILQAIKSSSLVAFTTPMYFFGMSAQMKALVDHMIRWQDDLKMDKTAVLVAVAPVDNFDHIKSEFKAIFADLGWTFGGQVLAGKVPDAQHLRFYPEVAYQLGKSFFEHK